MIGSVERDPAPLRWLALLLGPVGLSLIAVGLYDLFAERAHVGPLTSVLIIAVGGLSVWSAFAFARRQQHWWDYAVAIAAWAALNPLIARATGDPMAPRPTAWVGLLVLVAVYAAVRGTRRRLAPERPSEAPSEVVKVSV
jgi:chromate transport protein ChrA